MEFRGLGDGRSGHARDLFVHLEEVLEGDRRQGLVLAGHLDAFLGFQRLVQPFAITPALEDTAGKLVDDQDLAVLDDVIDVALEQQ